MHKIGIFGGSFDPIHLGHIQLALQAEKELNLEKILFVPAKYQPFKLNIEYASEKNRVDMLVLALREYNKLEISYEELDNDEISYTINTLIRIKKAYSKETEVFFILGTDAFINIELWYKAKELLTNFSFAVGIRPGYKEDELKACIEKIQAAYNTNVILLNNKELPISSTDIKNNLRAGKSIEGLVPEGVGRYIHENGLYK